MHLAAVFRAPTMEFRLTGPNQTAPSAEVGRASSIDWDYFSRQTFGDGDLQTELLILFDRQATELAARMAAPAGDDQNGSRRDLAHMIKGSARAIGAFEVGRAAEAFESALNGGGDDPAERLGALEAALRRAQEEIAGRLERR